MYLHIQAKPAQVERSPLFGRNFGVSIALVESFRIDGKPKQKHLCQLAYIVVDATELLKLDGYFYRDFRQKLKKLDVEKSKQIEFQKQIEKLIEIINAAKLDNDLRAELSANPNKTLSKLRRQ
jgi:plasmid maintenance system killer protein